MQPIKNRIAFIVFVFLVLLSSSAFAASANMTLLSEDVTNGGKTVKRVLQVDFAFAGPNEISMSAVPVNSKGEYLPVRWTKRNVISSGGTLSGSDTFAVDVYLEDPEECANKCTKSIEFRVVDESGKESVIARYPVPPSSGNPGSGGDGGDDGSGSDPGSGGNTGGDNGTDPGGSGGDGPGDGGGSDNGSGGGDGSGNDPGSGGSCGACEVLKCPGWDDIADRIGEAVGDNLPPPPDWEEVAEIMGDEIVPRMKNAMEDLLGHPDPPPTPPKGEFHIPVFNGATGKLQPEPTGYVGPAGKRSFEDVPSVPVEQDNTGGISLLGADPTNNIPHSPEGYKPEPGKETGGIKPKTKPVETPVPSNGNNPPPITSDPPKPGTSNGPPPIPDASKDPPPIPEMTMPK